MKDYTTRSGLVYRIVPENRKNGCDGCAFDGNSPLQRRRCMESPQCDGLIYVEAAPQQSDTEE